MLSCWERLPWESLWHKPKEMLIAEPYEASIRAPNDLPGLGHPCLRILSPPCPWSRGPISVQPQARSPALRNSGGVPVPKLSFEPSFWIDLTPGWWPRLCLMVTGLSAQPNTAHWHPETLHMSGFFLHWCTWQMRLSIFSFKASLSFWFFQWSDFRNSYQLTYFGI